MNLVWTPLALGNYLYWQEKDKKVLQRINELLRDIQRTPFSGIGKPEPLKNALKGKWSRRIDEFHRIVYFVKNDDIVIFQCRYHY